MMGDVVCFIIIIIIIIVMGDQCVGGSNQQFLGVAFRFVIDIVVSINVQHIKVV